ncbi:zinc finger protein 260-like isoform X16 [Venturia canescens]|uniref:zinc finger protein 260-like isoform X16 n=1 Tax=Venturia canescens TaxID=32260 RepID=UPI001C9C4055|nr:zinc finger protein 260-like isoform X16 [Venturia canescens]
MSSLDYLDLCRLCLVKDRVSVPIFEGEGDVRQIFLKIAACLPVKVGREDKLPKKICDDCVYKVELFYQFWNTTANAEKQLLQWLGEVSMDDKQGYVTGAHDPSMMKPGQNTGENRLDGSSVMQQVNEHTNNMGMGMMDGMGIGMPMMIPNSGQQPQQQQMTSVPMDTGGNAVQNVQPVPGPSAQIGQQKINAPTNEDEDEDESEEEDNSDDECDGDDGLPVKEESEDEPNRTIEPTTFVNVSLACDEAGPSGLQQQKIGEMPEMVMPPTDGDPKSGDFDVDGAPPTGVLDVKEEDSSGKIGEADPLAIGHDCSIDSTRKILRSRNVVAVEKIGRKSERKREKVVYECAPCGYKFSRRAKFERHMNSHNRKKPEPETFECEICKQSFPRKSAFASHMLKHSSEKPHKCKVCGKGFKRPWEVTAHLKIHTGSMYTCEICNFETAYKVSLKTHHRRVHQKDYPYKCDKCEKAFMSKYELDDHLTSHLGTKDFICEICGNAYSQRTYLLYHKRVIHGVQNRAPKELKCDMCEKTFASEYCLQNHVSLHSQKFLCSQCGKEFASNHSLKMHSRMHTGERPYSCNVCPKSFSRSNALAVHKLTHIGVRPYVCDLCDKSFTQRTTMMAHRRKHPGSHPPPPPTSLSKYENVLDSSL